MRVASLFACIVALLAAPASTSRAAGSCTQDDAETLALKAIALKRVPDTDLIAYVGVYK
jgi:hypothetical protein